MERLPSEGGLRIDSEARLLHHGIGRDACKAHFMLSWLDLADVKPDRQRRDDGRVKGYSKCAKLLLHALRLLPEGFAADGLTGLRAS